LQGLNKPKRRNRKKNRIDKAEFVEVVAVQAAARLRSGTTVRVDDRMSIILEPDFDREVLASVVSVLKEQR